MRVSRSLPFIFLSVLATAAQAQVATPRHFGMNASGDDYDLNPPPVGAAAATVVQGRIGLMDVALYGNPLYDYAETGRVAVFRFESDGSTVRTGSIDLTDRIGEEMYFGTALALDAGTAIVMSPAALRVYQQDGGTWVERSRTLSDDPNFVFAAGPLAFKDGTLAIPMQDKRDPSAALSIFIYDINKRGKARHVTTLHTPEGTCSLSSMVLHNHRLMIGVPCDAGTGAVYVYEEGKNPSKWTLAQRVVPNDPQTASAFGTSVDLRKGMLVVGAPYASQAVPAGPDPWDYSIGVGYVFERSGTQWVQQQKLDPSLMGLGATGAFGTAVAVTGTRVAFSAPQSTTGRAADRGYVYIFKPTGTELVYEQSEMGNLNFGDYMHSTKRWLVIGQPGDPYGQEYAVAVTFETDFP